MKKMLTSMAIIATVFISSLPVSAIGLYPINSDSVKQYTVIDDKGMLSEKDFYKREGYKYLYDGDYLYRAMPAYRSFSFVLNEDVDFENADIRVNEIFREFYPEENYNDDEYVPFISARTTDNGVTTYTSYFSNKPISSSCDEIVIKAKKYSKDMMKKLYDEELISAFYDFGEVYDIEQQDKPYDLLYWATDDITLINEYIVENDINCTMEKISDYFYELEPADDMDVLDKFNLAVDIYEETSIKIKGWATLESGSSQLYGKNALDEIKDSTIPSVNFGTPTIAGDIDLNNEQGTADIIVLSKYIANSQLYPITDPTALANADMNQDKEVNSLDANILVEMSLGDYENIVS